MSPTSLRADAQADALRHEIERQAKEEGRSLIEAAEREAEAIIAQAYAGARRRLREALVGLRREGAGQIARAKAQAEMEAHRRAQQASAAVIGRACPLVSDALLARWRDPVTRGAWISAAARNARELMRGDDWKVEHPVDWNADAEQHFRNGLGLDGASVSFVAHPSLAAGIKIRAMQATFDATDEGLLADQYTIAGLLLAEIAQSGERHGAVSNGKPQ